MSADRMTESSVPNAKTGGSGRGLSLWGGAFRMIKGFLHIPLAILAALFVGQVIFLFGVIPTGSMEPTYATGSLFLGNRLISKENFERGDPILFYYDEGIIYVKRVIGIPGDVVSFEAGAVVVNNQPLDESDYLPPGVVTERGRADRYTVPDESYFVLGDNRSASSDSRYWAEPFVSFDDVIAKPLIAIRIPFLSKVLPR